MTVPINIIIADDHEIFRKGFEVLLEDQSEIQLVGMVRNGQELLDQVDLLCPDVIITDIQMPFISGIEATKRLSITHPQIGIIALTMFEERYMVQEMIDAGASGYLKKNTGRQELLEAVKKVFRGGYHFPDNLLHEGPPEYKNLNIPVDLTELEIKIIQLICQEYSSKQIAAELRYSIRTIENYREKIQAKIGAKNMAGIITFAIKYNIYKP